MTTTRRRGRTAGTALALLACAPLFGANCGSDNVEACLAYVEARNAAYVDCNLADRQVDPDETCPPTLNESGIDCSAYYESLAGSFACEAGEVTWDASGSCT